MSASIYSAIDESTAIACLEPIKYLRKENRYVPG